MEKKLFFEQLKEVLEFEGELNEKSTIQFSSLTTLAVIVLVDENFSKTLEINELKKVASVDDLITLIGIEHFN